MTVKFNWPRYLMLDITNMINVLSRKKRNDLNFVSEQSYPQLPLFMSLTYYAVLRNQNSQISNVERQKKRTAHFYFIFFFEKIKFKCAFFAQQLTSSVYIHFILHSTVVVLTIAIITSLINIHNAKGRTKTTKNFDFSKLVVD